MSLKARIDKIARELCFGEMFDGATMEELSSHAFGNGPARPGVLRAELFTAIRAIWMDLRNPERAAEAREDLEEYGIDPDATDDEIREQLLELGSREGLTGREMTSLRQCL